MVTWRSILTDAAELRRQEVVGELIAMSLKRLALAADLGPQLADHAAVGFQLVDRLGKGDGGVGVDESVDLRRLVPDICLSNLTSASAS